MVFLNEYSFVAGAVDARDDAPFNGGCALALATSRGISPLQHGHAQGINTSALGVSNTNTNTANGTGSGFGAETVGRW